MTPHSSTPAWKIPWMEEPGRLQSMGSLRVGHDLSDFTFTFHFHALEKEMATHSSVLAWRIPGMGEPGGLLSMGSHRLKWLSSSSWCLVVKLFQPFCDPVDCSLPGSSVHGILQARILECVAIFFPCESFWPRHRTHVSCIGMWILYHWATREAHVYVNICIYEYMYTQPYMCHIPLSIHLSMGI